MTKMLSCAGGVCAVNGMPVINQGDARIAKSTYGKGITADCYDASICSLVLAALANRDLTALPTPSGRTKLFDQIPATEGIPKELNQLAWLENNAGTSQAFYFPEVLADFGPLFQTSPDPRVYIPDDDVVFTSDHGATFRDFVSPATTHITNEYVKQLMDNDFAVMLGFLWTTPTADAGGKVTFTLGGTHKLVVSGYRDGAYPLRVNDIFDANQQWTRLVPLSQSTRSFGAAGVTQDALDASALAPLPSRFYLEFENFTEPTRPVCVITQIDAVSLNWRPPQRTLNWHWGAGWTHLMPFDGGGQYYLLAYNSNTGDVHFDKFTAAGSQTVWSGKWGQGWTSFAPFTWKNEPHLIAYNRNTGVVHFDHVRPDLKGSYTVWSGVWAKGFTHLSPFVIGGEPHFIAYNSDSGLVHFDRIGSDLHGSFTRFEYTWAAGWSTFMPFILEGEPHFIAYNMSNGTVHFDRIGRQGQLGGAKAGNDLFLDIRWKATWGAGWTHFVSLVWDGLPHFFAYNSQSGDIHFDRVGKDADGYTPLWTGTTSKGFTSAAPFVLDQKPYIVLYNQASGEVAYLSAIGL